MTIDPKTVSVESLEADLSLVRAILARDRKATADFVRLYSDHVYAFVWKRLAPRTDATDDLVQEIFLSAWVGLKKYSGSAPLRHWLLSIARNKVHDYYRRTLAERWALLEDEADSRFSTHAETLEDLLDRERAAVRAVELMNRLPYEYALLLRWRYWDQLSARQMADETGRTEKAIERMLARAREQFRRLWTDEKGGSGGDEAN